MLRAYPRVVLQDKLTEVEIKFDQETEVNEGEVYTVRHTCGEIYGSDKSNCYPIDIQGVGMYQSDNKPQDTDVTCQDKSLKISVCLKEEQEHVFRIYRKEGETPVGTVNIYSVAEDLYGLIPYKGDLHMHSHHSDGIETPESVAIECRKTGLDFMALTDHGKYHPSIECQKAFQNFDGMLQIYPGEEIHLPYHQVHILSIHGEESVNEFVSNHTETYYEEVKKMGDNCKNIPQNVDKYMLCATQWCFEKIREFKGLGVFCHPYWRREAGYNHCATLSDAIFDRQDFDAYELISGYNRREVDSNTLQVAKYHDLRVEGKRIPIIGVSDAHDIKNGDLFGRLYTIVMAKSAQFHHVREGIMSFKSVGVEHLEGEELRAYGEFRLVKYALFLTREFFPEHDKIAQEESYLMEAYAKGDTNVNEKLMELKKQMETLYTKALT